MSGHLADSLIEDGQEPQTVRRDLRKMTMPEQIRRNLRKITMPEQKISKPVRKKRHVAAALAVVILLLVCGATFQGQIAAGLKRFTEMCKHLGVVAVVVYAILVAFMNLMMFPTFPLMIGAGMLGQIVGVASVFGGLWVGSMLAFYLGRTLFHAWAKEELEKFAWMRVINAMIDEQGWWVVLLARMSPLVPAEVFNYACALTSLSIPSYGIGCLGSILPVSVWVIGAAATQQAGNAASQDISDERKAQIQHLLFLGGNVVFLVVLSSILVITVRKYQDKAALAIDNHVETHGAHLSEVDKRSSRRMLTKSLHSMLVDEDYHHESMFSRKAEDADGEAASKCTLS